MIMKMKRRVNGCGRHMNKYLMGDNDKKYMAISQIGDSSHGLEHWLGVKALVNRYCR